MKLKIYKRGLSNFTIEMISHTAPRHEAIKTLFGLRKKMIQQPESKSTKIEITNNDLECIEVDIIRGTREIILRKEGELLGSATWMQFSHSYSIVEIGQKYEIGDAVKVDGRYQKCVVMERIGPRSYYVRLENGSKFFEIERHFMSEWKDQLWYHDIATGTQLSENQISNSDYSGHLNGGVGVSMPKVVFDMKSSELSYNNNKN